MPDRSIWVCPSRYRRLSTASVASLLRQNSEPAIADNALFQRLFRASQVYICRKTFGYLLSFSVRQSNKTRSSTERPGDSNLIGSLAIAAISGASRETQYRFSPRNFVQLRVRLITDGAAG